MQRLPIVIATLFVAWATASTSVAADLTVVASAGGALMIRDGDKSLATITPKTKLDERGVASVRELRVAGHQIVDVRIPVKAEGAKREEVWLAELGANGAKIIWWDMAGAKDTDGETSLVASASERGIEVYETLARLSRCDGVPVPLFRRTWDFATHRFRPAPPELPGPAEVTLEAKRGDAPTVKPLGGFYFAAASSSEDADGDAARIKPPAAINDGDPNTIWTGSGSGKGQLFTARSSSGFPITGLRLLPGDTRNEKSYRASARPKRLTLLFGREPSQRMDVVLVEDPDGGGKRFRVPYWIALPKPVASPCVTVLVQDVSNAKAPLSIADLDVFTTIDSPDADDRLVASLAQGISCPARLPLLVRLGTPVLDKVVAALRQAEPGPGRPCLLEALDALVSGGAPLGPDAVAAVTGSLRQASKDEEKIIFKLLRTVPGLALDGVSAILADDKQNETDRVRAARALVAMGGEGAVAKLVGALGEGAMSMRRAIRRAAIEMGPPAARAALSALRTTPAQASVRRADLYFVIGALAAHDQTLYAEALSALQVPLHEQASFEERAQAIRALGAIHTPAALGELIQVRSNDKDAILRTFAMTEIAGSPLPDAVPALRAALDDPDPKVREIAATGLGQKRDRSADKLLIAGAKQEPWPQTRRAEIVALGRLCTADGDALLLRAFKKDVEEVRQAALTGLAHCYGAKATPMLLRIFGRLPESADMRSLAVRLLAERRDPTVVPGIVEVLVRLVTESQADLSLEGVIAEAAMALASLRGNQAISALIGLLSDARPSVQRIAVDALGIVCDPGPGMAALHAAASGQDEAVAGPAKAAERHCRQTP